MDWNCLFQFGASGEIGHEPIEAMPSPPIALRPNLPLANGRIRGEPRSAALTPQKRPPATIVTGMRKVFCATTPLRGMEREWWSIGAMEYGHCLVS